MRRLAALAAVLSLLASAGVAVAGRGGPPAFPNLPGAWAHVEINERIARQPHTLILDRGRIVKATSTDLTLNELGTNVDIPLSPTTIIVFGRRVITPAQLRRGLYAETMRVDGGPAVRVRELLRP